MAIISSPLRTYPGCHPDGWCCLDVTCSRTDSCDAASATAAPPLQLPRDPVVTGCEVETHGERSFLWDPELEKNFNLMLLGGWEGLVLALNGPSDARSDARREPNARLSCPLLVMA